ncbi:MAG: hypothetical protein K1X53_13315 [Candidatus Sumerlaeaceae bacterium]|nr:hypothetical protein [Candidatus Sumerlaeaceae bacterium]
MIMPAGTLRRGSTVPLTGWIIVAVTLITVFAIWGHDAATRALWTDDVHSLRIAELPPGEMFADLKTGAAFFFEYPPFYFVFLHQVLRLGDSPLILRVPSMLFSVAAISLWAIFARRRGVSMLLCIGAILLASTHPMLAFQSIGVRMYSLLLLLGSVPMIYLGGGLWREATHPAKPIILLGLVLALACYTAYFGLVFCAALALVAVSWCVIPHATWRSIPRRARATGLVVLGAGMVAALLYLPWMGIAIETLRGSSSLNLPPTSREARYLALLRELPGTYWGAGLLVVGWVALIAWAAPTWRRALFWSLAPGALTVILLLVFSPSYRAIFTRYVLFIIPPLYLGAVSGWYALGRRLKLKPNVAGILTLAVAGMLSAWQVHAARQTLLASVPDWWAAAKVLEREAKPDEVILTGGYMSGEAILYHLRDPERFQFRHYASTYEEFSAACNDPKVTWSVNAQVYPPRFAAVHDQVFPHRIAFRGNAGLGMIQISCKHPFAVPEELKAELVPRGPGNSDVQLGGGP